MKLEELKAKLMENGEHCGEVLVQIPHSHLQVRAYFFHGRVEYMVLIDSNAKSRKDRVVATYGESGRRDFQDVVQLLLWGKTLEGRVI